VKRALGARPSRPLLLQRAGGSPELPGASRPGLSLIEVMLALTILLLSLAAIGQLVDMGSERGMDARLTMRGNRLVQAKMAEVEVGAIPVQNPGQGSFDGDDSAWSWNVDSVPAGPPNLYRVTVTVSRDVRGQTFMVTLSQMIFDPALMGSAAQAERPPDSTSTDTSGTGGTSP